MSSPSPAALRAAERIASLFNLRSNLSIQRITGLIDAEFAAKHADNKAIAELWKQTVACNEELINKIKGLETELAELIGGRDALKEMMLASNAVASKAMVARAELIEVLRVLTEVFQSFCNDVGNHEESYQRQHIESAMAIVAKHSKIDSN